MCKSFQTKFHTDAVVIEKCSKCKNKQLKDNFYKDITRRDGIQKLCIICSKQKHSNRKKRRNAYERQRRNRDFIFKLLCNIRTL